MTISRSLKVLILKIQGKTFFVYVDQAFDLIEGYAPTAEILAVPSE